MLSAGTMLFSNSLAGGGLRGRLALADDRVFILGSLANGMAKSEDSESKSSEPEAL